MNPRQYIAALAAGITLALSACGGQKPTPAPDVIATSPKSSAQVVAPASAASAPVAASAPASADTAASTPAAAASDPVAASNAAASEPTASAPTPASTPAMATTPIIEIDVYGADDMSGISMNAYGMPPLVTPDEPQALQTSLQSAFNDSGVTVANFATGGTASSLQNLLAGVDGGGDPFAQRVMEHPGVIVIDNHGINDALGGETLQDYTTDLAQFINDVRAAGKTPVLEEPGPVCDGNHPQLANYVQAMDSVASSYGVALIQQYNAIQSISGWCDHMANGFYPDAYIDAIKAKQELAVLAPLVQNLIGS